MFKWIADSDILPPIHTIKKIESEGVFVLHLGEVSITTQYYIPFPAPLFNIMKSINKEFIYNHLDTVANDIKFEVPRGREVYITYSKISYEECGVIYDVRVIKP